MPRLVIRYVHILQFRMLKNMLFFLEKMQIVLQLLGEAPITLQRVRAPSTDFRVQKISFPFLAKYILHVLKTPTLKKFGCVPELCKNTNVPLNEISATFTKIMLLGKAIDISALQQT